MREGRNGGKLKTGGNNGGGRPPKLPDLHILLERGYLTLTEALQIEVSRRIKEDFENGKEYYALQGKNLEVVPVSAIERPSREFIQWHNENRFLG